MSLFDFRTATIGCGIRSKLRILSEHLNSVLRHMTISRLLNLLKSEKDRILHRSIVNSMPFFLKIETTGLCNLKCRWCTGSRKERSRDERSAGRMTFEQFRSILDQTGRYLFRINLYGFGEPLIFPETFAMVREASSRNIGVVISSNMNVGSPSLTTDLLDCGLELLIFSCHGTTDETVKKFMGFSADIHRALENVADLVRERKRKRSRFPIIQWQYCVTGFNEHQMEEAAEIAEKLGIDAIRFIKPWFPPNAEDEWYSTLFPLRSIESSDYRRRSCSWPYRGAYISWDGGMLPCCREELYPENDFGNVLSEEFQNIWNGSRYRESRKLINAPDSFQPRCRTICSTCSVLGFKPAEPTWERHSEEQNEQG